MTRRSASRPVSIELSDAQVDQVVATSRSGGGFRDALSGLLDNGAAPAKLSSLNTPQLSRSLLAGLLILLAFPDDGSYLGNADIAQRLEMSVTTTHRYISTLHAAGLLERDSKTRKYRRAR
jgi:DNA-binding MarR family transcriptional regulator